MHFIFFYCREILLSISHAEHDETTLQRVLDVTPGQYVEIKWHCHGRRCLRHFVDLA